MINSLHIKLTRIRDRIAGLRPAFKIFMDKLNDLLRQACLIAFGPDAGENPEGAKAWQGKADMIAAVIVIFAFMYFLIHWLIWLI